MGRDRSYDRGRAWSGGNEEEGGYGGSGLSRGDYGSMRPRYGRPVDEPSPGGVEYRPVPDRFRDGEGYDRGAQNPSYRGSGYEGRGPRNYTRSSERIAEEINEAFTDNPLLDPSDVEVRVENNEVTLEGTVDTRHSKRLAEEIAESVRGVHDVHNRLRLRNTGPERDPVDAPTL
jgi:hypothetical protein